MARLHGLLRESERQHVHCDDSWYCCRSCEHEDHGAGGCGGYYKNKVRPGKLLESACDCGAAQWNARVQAALGGRP